MSFLPKDDIIYDECWDVTPVALVSKGDAVLIQDCFGFYMTGTLTIGDEVTFVYRMRQVLATKATGTGEAIVAGDRVFYIVANDNISSTPAGTPGTNSYFCGWAKEDATASATTVLINFDGTRQDETLT